MRAVVFAAALALACIGVAFLAYGLYLALIPSVSVATAALLTALASIAVSAVLIAILVARAPAPPQPAPVPVEAAVVETNAMIKTLSELAQDHPIMAVCAAALLGATTTNASRRR